MSKVIAAIHVAKRDMGLDEDTYRGLLERVTGKVSLRLMTSSEHIAVLDDMRAKGAGVAHVASGKLAGPYAAKLQALWLSGWNLGVVRNKADEALIAFVKARTGIDHTRFLRNAADARKAVEALKAMLARDGGVDWSAYDDPQDCVLDAQRRLLNAGAAVMTIAGAAPADSATTDALHNLGKIALMQIRGDEIRAMKAGA